MRVPILRSEQQRRRTRICADIRGGAGSQQVSDAARRARFGGKMQGCDTVDVGGRRRGARAQQQPDNSRVPTLAGEHKSILPVAGRGADAGPRG
jgi:hypothetical protein